MICKIVIIISMELELPYFGSATSVAIGFTVVKLIGSISAIKRKPKRDITKALG